ncbi:MAG: hypothetical protein J7M14_01955, partial [Planctomycetes bacterium]|nr:hypothetical protein [Planctomycetota bacterium]
ALFKSDAMVQSADTITSRAEEAVRQYEENPTITGKINAAVDALIRMETKEADQRAIDILTKAYERTNSYQFKVRIGDIRIEEGKRRFRELVKAGDKVGAAEQAKKQLEFELAEFAERSEKYPTDLSVKFELGRRQFLSNNLDEAIASFQQAARDPRRRLAAMNYLGQAFARKGWAREAAETYEKALEGELPETREKDLRYSLGGVLVDLGELERAQDEYSKVAQMDFGYKDVRERLEAVRKQVEMQSSETGAGEENDPA